MMRILTKCSFLYFSVSGCCKHVGALLWYIEQEVRFGHNKTCTSKKQQWSVPSSRQQSIHNPDTVENISMSKSKAKRVIGPSESPSKKRVVCYDPRQLQDRNMQPLQSGDIDTLANITNGRCGIVLLMREASQENDFQSGASFQDVETTVSNLPEVIDNIIEKLEVGEGFPSFLQKILITPEQQRAVEEATVD